MSHFLDDEPKRTRRRRKPAEEILSEDRIAVQQIIISDLLAEHDVTDAEERSKLLRAYMLWAIKRCASEGNMPLMHKFLDLASRDVKAGILPAPAGQNINVQTAVMPGAPPRTAVAVPTELPPMAPELQKLALAALPTGDPDDDITEAEIVS